MKKWWLDTDIFPVQFLCNRKHLVVTLANHVEPWRKVSFLHGWTENNIVSENIEIASWDQFHSLLQKCALTAHQGTMCFTRHRPSVVSRVVELDTCTMLYLEWSPTREAKRRNKPTWLWSIAGLFVRMPVGNYHMKCAICIKLECRCQKLFSNNQDNNHSPKGWINYWCTFTFSVLSGHAMTSTEERGEP